MSAYESISSHDTYLDLAPRGKARLAGLSVAKLRAQEPHHPTWESYLCPVMNVSFLAIYSTGRSTLPPQEPGALLQCRVRENPKDGDLGRQNRDRDSSRERDDLATARD